MIKKLKNKAKNNIYLLLKNEKIFKKIKKQFSKKIPHSEKYPYFNHDQYALFGDDVGLGSLYFVGDNWTSKPDAPIAIMWGFNDWKLGFVSDYLQEYRTLYVPRKMNRKFALFRMRKLIKSERCCFVVWGYTDGEKLEKFTRRKKIDLYRMEDGFVRSASLGASHSTPYSLVFDKNGIYYNAEKPSDLENLFNELDFSSYPDLIAQAKSALDNILKLKLSKYNDPKSVSRYLAEKIKVKKRVVVLGQVDSDMSIKYGNPDNWTSEQLVEVARIENPNAEVYYRPHPEIYAGYQRSKARKKHISKYAEIVSPEEPLVNFLDTIDHVYTISSLSGFEALIRGKKVTVVGAPFYSGWGPTDDRVKIKRRSRKLTVLELFAIAYIHYPKYLSNLESNYFGLLSSCYKVHADKYIIASDRNRRSASDLSNTSLNLNDVFEIYCSNAKLPEGASINFSDCGKFIRNQNNLTNLIFSSIFIGMMNSEEQVSSYLSSVRHIMTSDNYNELLITLDDEINFDTSKEVIWLLQNYSEKYIVDDISRSYVKPSINLDLEDADSNIKDKKHKGDINFNNSIFYNDVLSAVDAFCRLSLIGCSDKKQLLDIVKAFDSRLMLKEQASILNKFVQVDLRCFNKLPALLLNSYCYLDETVDPEKYFINACILVSLKPEIYDSVVRQMEEIDISNGSEYSRIIKDLFVLCYEYRINFVNYLIEIGQFDRAESLLYAMSRADSEDDIKTIVTYSKLSSLRGDFTRSLSILRSYLNTKYSFPVAKEYLRILNSTGNFNESNLVIERMIENGDDVAPALKMPILQSEGKIGEAYSKYMEFSGRLTLNKFIPDKVLKFTPQSDQKIFALSAYGPGDEIRFCSIYSEIIKHFDDVIFSCDERLESLIRRSFPKINLIPVSRVRNVSRVTGLERHDCLPDRALSSILDNNLFSELKNDTDRKVIFVPELISVFRNTKDDFHSKRIFAIDEILSHKIKNRLPKNKFLVGINWRSSLSGASRSQSYLEVKQLSKLFSLEDITFVNLQYDQCNDELAYIKENFGCDIIDLDDIDQYNDFDSVAALMNCLNLVIAPCTSVAELAGAIGTRTLFFANSEEITWRIDKNGYDVWFNSISHVFPDNIGDKESLVENICREVSKEVAVYKSSSEKLMSVENG